jgi:hypothetical protein
VPVAYTTRCQLNHHGEQLHTQQQHPWLCRCSSTNVAVNLGSFNSSGDAHEPWLQGTTTCYRHPPVALSEGTTANAQKKTRSIQLNGTLLFRA